MKDETENTKLGLPPVLDAETEILILGSLPGDESIRQGKYYAKSGNDFWKLVGASISEDLLHLEYEDRIAVLKKHRIGLWDVFNRGKRVGSSDSRINDPVINDITIIKTRCPKIRLLCFNGKKAGESESMFKALGCRTKLLPSSSGANRKDNSGRVKIWSSILE